MKTDIHCWSNLAHFLLGWEMFQIKVVEKIKKYILCSVTIFFGNLAVYEIMCRNVVVSGRPQATIWRMSIACWLHKSTNTHSDYAFPLQKCLHGIASMLRLYLHCFSFCSSFCLEVTRRETQILFRLWLFPCENVQGACCDATCGVTGESRTVKIIQEGIEGSRRMCLPICALGARRLRVLNTTPRPLYPSGRPALLVLEDGWAAETVWRGPGVLASSGVRKPDRPARSEVLYRHEKIRISSRESAPDLYLKISWFVILVTPTDFLKSIAEWRNNRHPPRQITARAVQILTLIVLLFNFQL
jgi:hypothetical protein